MVVLFTVIVMALMFEFINGFHDTANSIATVVSTRVLSPRQAIVLASVTNLLGALWGTAVAKTIASGLVDSSVVTNEVIIAALIGGIVWNLFTWYIGLPSSSSHALVGGLCGAAVAAAHNSLDVIIWSQPSANHWYEGKGVLWKIIVPMIVSPLLGFAVGVVLMMLMYLVFQKLRPRTVNMTFGKLQIFSAAAMGFMHGTNDAQKTMGIIALALVAATSAGVLSGDDWLSQFLHTSDPGTGLEIATWIKLVCAVTMAAGTAMGGWRIIRTLGHKMVRLQPVNGFAAETSSSIILWFASSLGIPVSTTHNITASVLGVGAAKNVHSVRWLVVERILWAWVFTLPGAGIVAYGVSRLLAGN
jgi:inorganic phosphate transporter, PiT family